MRYFFFFKKKSLVIKGEDSITTPTRPLPSTWHERRSNVALWHVPDPATARELWPLVKEKKNTIIIFPRVFGRFYWAGNLSTWAERERERVGWVWVWEGAGRITLWLEEYVLGKNNWWGSNIVEILKLDIWLNHCKNPQRNWLMLCQLPPNQSIQEFYFLFYITK